MGSFVIINIINGSVFQYVGADQLNSTATVAFTERTTNTGGILSLDGIVSTSSTGARMEFNSDKIVVKDSAGNIRIKFGNLA